MPDPNDSKTLEAIEKIKAILREHDLWACFTVVSITRAHWVYHFEPSWSCLSFDPTTGAARIRAKRGDFATDDQHHKVIELTTGAIAASRDFGAKAFSDCSQLYGVLEKQFKITHTYSDPQVHNKP